MFNKNSSHNPPNPTENQKKPVVVRPTNSGPSILGRDLVVTGELKTDGDVQIDGQLDGNVTASKVTIGEQGAVNGEIEADAVYVRGKVSGKIIGDIVELAETSNVLADIVQEQLTIANGAFFDGKCSRRKKVDDISAPVPLKPKAEAKAK